MSTKVLALNGSPRGNKGNTDLLLQSFLKGMEEKGAVTETIYVKDLKINPCSGCFSCWNKTPGICIFKDDMVELLPKLVAADFIIWATPLYHVGMTTILKAVLERSLPLAKPYIVKNREHFTHPPRFEGPKQKTLLISTCGFPERHNFDSLVEMFSILYGETNTEFIGSILCVEAELLRQQELKDSLHWYLDACHDAGKEVIDHGKISDKTAKILEKEFVELETFIGFANASWDVPGDTPPTLEEALKGMKNKVDTNKDKNSACQLLEYNADYKGFKGIIAGMAYTANPEKCKDLDLTIQYDVTGEEPGQYFFRIFEGSCQAYEGTADASSCVVHTSSQVWRGICDGNLDGEKAMLEGRYRVDGSLGAFLTFIRILRTNDESVQSAPTSTQPETGTNSEDVSIYIQGMTGIFNPQKAGGLKAILQFNINDINNSKDCYLKIENGKCTYHEGKAANPTTTIATPSGVWIAVSKGELDGAAAMMDGKYTVTGDFSLMMRFGELFTNEHEKNKPGTTEIKGPIKLKGMGWLTVAFLPWTIYWIFDGIFGGISSYAIPFLVSIIVLFYRKKFLELTAMDMGSAVFFGISTILYSFVPDIFNKLGGIISSLSMLLIWLTTMASDIPLTASYSKFDYPDGLGKNVLFLKTNAIITVFWVGIYMLQAMTAVIRLVDVDHKLVWIIFQYGLLIPAFIFTSKFPDWYPAYVASGKRRQSITNSAA